jgi:hypothetical protein
MKIIKGRNEDSIEVKRISVIIGDNQYILTESIDGKLNVNKISDSDEFESDLIRIYPRTGNEIELK